MRFVRSFLFGLGVFALFSAIPLQAPAQTLFNSWVSYGLDKQPTSVITADMDADGDSDMVICHFQGNTQGRATIFVMKNDGAGNFTRGDTLYPKSGARSVSVFDLDVDGDPDILTACPQTQRVNFFRNRGNGLGFDLPYECRTGFQPVWVTAGNLDNDAFPEVIAVNFTSGTLSLYKNRGSALYPAESIKVVGFGPRSVVLFDADNDGDNDLAVSVSANRFDRKEGFNGFVYFENQGNGAFDDSARVSYKILFPTNPTFLDTLLNPHQLIAADFDNDGFKDLALACSSSVTTPVNRAVVCVFRNLQDGTFATNPALANPARYAVGLGSRSITAADVDGDGDVDLVSANQADATISVLKNNGSGSFGPKRDFLTPNNPPSVVSGGDYDGDGDFDLAAVSLTGASVAVMLNKGTGDFEVGTEFSTGGSQTQGNLPFGVVCADFDADGDSDFAICNQANNVTTVHINNGAAVFPSPPPFLYFTGPPRSVAAADLDGDGDADMAVLSQAGFFAGDPIRVSIFTNNGNGSFAYGPQYPLSGGAFPFWITAADLDGDGDFDLATANQGHDSVSVLKNNGNATFAPAVSFPVGQRPVYIKAADFDGVNGIDLVTANEGRDDILDSLSVLFNDGSGGFAARLDIQVGSGTTAVEAADLDGDGAVDLVATAAGTPTREDTAVVVFKNNGNGTFASGVRYLPGNGPRHVIAADMDADGDLDLITSDSARSAVSYFENDGTGTFARSVEYGAGINPRFLAAGDLDGDGDLDLAVTNLRMVIPPPGQIHGGFTVLKNVGVFPRPAVRGDVNGDGVLNLVDVTQELNCVFLGAGNCPTAVTDVSCDGRLSPVDAVALMQRVFLGINFPC